MKPSEKLILSEERIGVSITDARSAGLSILEKAGCSRNHAAPTVDHLLDADMSGVESHGIMRVLQYHDEYIRGYLKPNVDPLVWQAGPVSFHVDGQGGLGIPAMAAATEAGIGAARKSGIVAVAVRNAGHTGRLGAFAEQAAGAGLLFIACGGGARERWRMVAPHGGGRAVLPTNPWCFAMPGGERGPVVLDCATGQIAGGWIYAARRAGAQLSAGCIVDRDGQPSRNPEDYFSGGAILPKGGVLGYGLATVAELICDAMLGPAKLESNTFILMVDTALYREASALELAAEAMLSELRTCPPAAGFDCVEIPGERERSRREKATEIRVPSRTWAALCAAASPSG